VNRIYRIVFNRSLGLRQVVSELARSRGKGGTKLRRLALSISAALESLAQSSSPGKSASPRRRYTQAASLMLPAAISLGAMLPVTAHADTPLGSTTTGVVLTQGGNPYVVDAGTTISSPSMYAIDGHSGVYTLTNSGSITGTGAVGVGFAGGVITNHGNISGYTVGVYLSGNSGASTVTNSGSIRGGNAGVGDANGSLVVNNSGYIVGTNGVGISLEAGGSVYNSGTARVTGAIFGVLASSSASVTNSGELISGTNTSMGIGVRLIGGGSVTNDAFSEINGGYIGVRIDAGAGTVTNAGGIVGGTNGVLMEGGGLVHNSGTITGTGDTSVLFGAANALATVTNDAGGLITGSKYGVHSLTTNSTITNSGMIQSTGAGVRFDGAGTITNSGTIFGTVAAKGVEFISSGVLTNQAGGYIKTGSISVLAQNDAVNINNYGRIVSTGTVTDTLRLLQGGTVTNAANATISGGVVGIYMAGGGSVTNGSSATIYGIFTGIQIGGSATVTNAGTISSFNNSYKSVLFTDNNNLLILQTGSSLIGAASATGTGSELQLDGSGSSSNTFSGFGTVSATGGTQWELSSDFSVAGNLSVSTDTGSQLIMSGNVDSQGLTKQGDGTLVIDGTATNSGSTEVMAGRLIVGSDTAHASAVLQGDAQVDSGATIGGHGELSGSLNVLGGAHLAPGNSIGTLTVGGDLTLAQGSQLDFEFGAPGANASQGASDSVAVHGNLSLNGTVLNISNTGSMGPGLYNLFTYGGTLTESNGGIAFGSTSGGAYAIQNLTASKQINLIDATSVTLAFWNANGQASPSQMGGGSGTWSVTAPKWTDSVGSTTGPMTPQPGFAIFGGAAGTVTVDNTAGTVSATGLQFASDGYTLAGDILTLVGTDGAAPVIRVGNGSAASAGWTATIGNVIAGSNGLDKTDLGTLVLTGNNTYAGATEVAAGTLDIEGDVASAVTVDTGATLTGIGVMGGLHATAGATVAPGGDAIGTLTVRGNATFESGSNYRLNVTDTGSSDLIHATGTATLYGGTVVGLAAGTNWNAGEKYTILTADGGVTGTFGSVTSNFAFLTPTLVYDANNAYLSLARNDLGFATLGLTRNERATAAAIEALGAEATLYQRIVTLDAAQAVASFDNLAGASLASSRTAIIDDSRYVRDAIGNHLQGIDDQAQSDDKGSVWTSTWGHWGSNDGNANTGSQNSNGSGLLVGADRDLGNTRLGAVIGHSQLSSNSGGDNAHGTADHVGLYAATEVGAWQLQGGAAHSWYQTSSQRTIVVPGLLGHANADYNSGVTQAYVDGGYRLDFAQGSLTPFVNLARVWMHEGAIHEHGNVADLDVQANGSDVNYGTAGLRGSYTPTKGIELHASLGYQHAWGDLASTDTQRFVGSVDSFTVDGVPVAKNAGIADVGLRFDLRKNISVDATYHGQFGGQAKDQSARLALNMSF
jgi:fibronectin-binding autotransporter adhesin